MCRACFKLGHCSSTPHWHDRRGGAALPLVHGECQLRVWSACTLSPLACRFAQAGNVLASRLFLVLFWLIGHASDVTLQCLGRLTMRHVIAQIPLSATGHPADLWVWPWHSFLVCHSVLCCWCGTLCQGFWRCCCHMQWLSRPVLLSSTSSSNDYNNNHCLSQRG